MIQEGVARVSASSLLSLAQLREPSAATVNVRTQEAVQVAPSAVSVGAYRADERLSADSTYTCCCFAVITPLVSFATVTARSVC